MAVNEPVLFATIPVRGSIGWVALAMDEIGFRSLSVPIRDRSGATLAALNVSCPSPRVSLKEMLGRILPATLDTTRRVVLALPE